MSDMADQGELREYDFSQGHNLSADELREMQEHCANLCRSLRRYVPETLGVSADFGLIELMAIVYDAYLDMLPGNPVIVVCETTRYHLPVVWQIDMEPLLAYFDSVLGGDGTYTPLDNPQLTALQSALAIEAVSDFLRTWTDAWPTLERAALEPTTIMQTKAGSRNISLQEPLVLAIIELKVSETTGRMRIAFPPTMLRDVLEGSSSGSAGNAAGHVNDLRHNSALSRCPVSVCAKLAQTRMTLKQISELEVGDVVKLNCGPNDPVEIAVAGKCKYSGISGVAHGSLAVQLTGVVEAWSST